MIQKALLFILISLSIGVAPTAFARSIPKETALKVLTDWDEELRANTGESDPSFLREKDLEKEFVHRLIFQVERKYQENEAAKFLTKTIWDMYLTDRMTVNQSFGGQQLFLSVLHQAMEEVLEPQEDPLIFIKNFTRFSSIQDPVELEDFAATRNYFDGKTSIQFSPMDSGQAAEVTAEKLKKTEFIDFLEGYNLLDDEQDLRSEFPNF